MWHRECGGRVFADTWTNSMKFVELTCVTGCGKVWYVDRNKNALGKAITEYQRARVEGRV